MNNKSIIPSTWEVPDIFRRRLGTGPGRQRAMEADGHLLLILHAPPKPDEDQREGRLFWRDPNGEWRTNLQGTGTAALERHMTEFQVELDKLEEAEHGAQSAHDYFDVIEKLAPLQRALRNMHAVFQDARKKLPDASEIINYRDRAYELDRTTDLLMYVSKTGLDFAVAKRAEEQAQNGRQMAVASHRLNLLVAFFFPLATLTAAFGVNLKHGMEDNPAPWTFVGLIALGLVSGAILTSFVIQKGR